MGLFEMRNPVLLIREPKLIKQILVRDFDHFVDHRVIIDEKIEHIFGRNLLALSGDKWKRMRNTLTPAFTGSKLRYMMPFVHNCCDELNTHFLKEANQESPLVVDMKDLFTRFTNDVIATCAFGIEVNSFKEKDNHFYDNGKAITDFGGVQSLKIFGYSIVPWLMKLLNISVFPKGTVNFFKYVVQDAMNYREQNGTIRPDMIHLLMEAKRGRLQNEANQENNTMDWEKDDLIAQCLIFFVAGFETSSSLMCFASHELAVNPAVQCKLIEEIDEVKKSLDGRELAYDDFQHLKYMDKVINETLRKWPPAMVTDRICTKPYSLQTGTQLIQINVGDSVWIPIAGLHHDSKYFPDPQVFDPERFSDENKPSSDSFTFIPFGGGPRNCIGLRFAIMECKTVLFKLLSKFTFEISEKTQNPLKLAKSGFAFKAEKGFWIILKPRFL